MKNISYFNIFKKACTSQTFNSLMFFIIKCKLKIWISMLKRYVKNIQINVANWSK